MKGVYFRKFLMDYGEDSFKAGKNFIIMSFTSGLETSQWGIVELESLFVVFSYGY
jgi:hypothetical protein